RASRVLPHPAAPHIRVGRPRGKPPWVISSRPLMPVEAFSSFAAVGAAGWVWVGEAMANLDRNGGTENQDRAYLVFLPGGRKEIVIPDGGEAVIRIDAVRLSRIPLSYIAGS